MKILQFFLSILLFSTVLPVAGCGSDNPVESSKLPKIVVSEITMANGGQQAKFTWGSTGVYRLNVKKKDTGGFMWSWEVAGPSFAVRDGIVYGATPSGALCSIHKCQADGLKRKVPYEVIIWYGLDEKMSLDFTL